MQKSFIKNIIFNTIFVLFVIRILFLILMEPYIGIADNGDFQRLMQPIGIAYSKNPWSEQNREEYFFNFITNDYVIDEPTDNGWHQIFSVFPRLGVGLSKINGSASLDIRVIGGVNAFFYFAAVYFLFWLIKQIEGIYSYVLLCIFAIVLSDSIVIQYFNSFYTEIGSVTGILMLWCSFIYSFLYIKESSVSVKVACIVLNTIIALMAILSKQQDILLIFPIVIMFWILLDRFETRAVIKIIWLVVFISTVLIMFVYNKAGGNITTFNVINKEFLAESKNPQKHLVKMGLGEKDIERISATIGKTAFDEEASGIWSEYGMYYTRRNECMILLREPSIFFKQMVKRSQSLFKDIEYGNYMKSSGAEPREKTKKNRLWYNIKTHLYQSDFSFYIIVILVSLGMIYLGVTKAYLTRIIPKDVFMVYTLLPIGNILRFIAVILGDANEDIKHFFTVNFEFDFMYVINIILLVYIISHEMQTKVLGRRGVH